jgi:hypothetical protein
MDTRSLNRPSYVVAILLGFVALVDAGNGFMNMQVVAVCPNFSNGLNVSCGNSNAGWLVDLGACIVSSALLAFLLLRPYFVVFVATFGWSAVACLTNLAMRHSDNGPDPIATVRMTVYLVVAVVSGVLAAIEFEAKKRAEKEAAAAVPAPPPAPPAPPAAPAR